MRKAHRFSSKLKSENVTLLGLAKGNVLLGEKRHHSAGFVPLLLLFVISLALSKEGLLQTSRLKGQVLVDAPMDPRRLRGAECRHRFDLVENVITVSLSPRRPHMKFPLGLELELSAIEKNGPSTQFNQKRNVSSCWTSFELKVAVKHFRAILNCVFCIKKALLEAILSMYSYEHIWGGGAGFIGSQTRPLHANEGNRTTRRALAHNHPE